jgi:hypothetical protein
MPIHFDKKYFSVDLNAYAINYIDRLFPINEKNSYQQIK